MAYKKVELVLHVLEEPSNHRCQVDHMGWLVLLKDGLGSCDITTEQRKRKGERVEQEGRKLEKQMKKEAEKIVPYWYSRHMILTSCT